MITELKARIEKLKDEIQAQAFALRSEDEQAVFARAGSHNCLLLSDVGTWGTMRPNTPFRLPLTYLLKPGYEPKPEHEDIEIKTRNGFVFVHSKSCSVRVHRAVDREDFVGFFFGGFLCGEKIIRLDQIAGAIRDGHKVYARFVKEQ